MNAGGHSKSNWDSRIGLVVIQGAGWEGVGMGWESRIRLIFANVRLRRS
jgi:hypothetical protein